MARKRPDYLRVLEDPQAPQQEALPGIEPAPSSQVSAELARKRTEEWKDEAGALFDQVYAELTPERRASLDLPLFRTYVDTLARYLRAERDTLKYGDVIKSPSGYPIQSPFLSVRNAAAKELRSLSKQLGFTHDATNGKGKKTTQPAGPNPFANLRTID